MQFEKRENKEIRLRIRTKINSKRRLIDEERKRRTERSSKTKREMGERAPAPVSLYPKLRGRPEEHSGTVGDAKTCPSSLSLRTSPTFYHSTVAICRRRGKVCASRRLFLRQFRLFSRSPSLFSSLY